MGGVRGSRQRQSRRVSFVSCPGEARVTGERGVASVGCDERMEQGEGLVGLG